MANSKNTIEQSFLVVRMKEYRKQVSASASKANKRLEALARSPFAKMGAFKKWADEGGVKFSVRGKQGAALEKEVKRINDFLNSATGGVKKAREYLDSEMKRAGLDRKSVEEDWTALQNFWRIYNRIQQLIDPSEIMAALESDQFKDEISNFAKQAKIDLYDANLDIEAATEAVAQVRPITLNHDLEQLDSDNWLVLGK